MRKIPPLRDARSNLFLNLRARSLFLFRGITTFHTLAQFLYILQFLSATTNKVAVPATEQYTVLYNIVLIEVIVKESVR